MRDKIRIRFVVQFLAQLAADGISVEKRGERFDVTVHSERLLCFDTHDAAVRWLAYTLNAGVHSSRRWLA